LTDARVEPTMRAWSRRPSPGGRYPVEPYTEVIPALPSERRALARRDVVDVRRPDRRRRTRSMGRGPRSPVQLPPARRRPFIADPEMIHQVGGEDRLSRQRREARRGELSERREPLRAPGGTCSRGTRLHTGRGDRGGAPGGRWRSATSASFALSTAPRELSQDVDSCRFRSELMQA
jgi:hypothetical protein